MPVTASPSCASSLRGVERDEDVVVVVLVHPRLEDARDLEVHRCWASDIPSTRIDVIQATRVMSVTVSPGTTFEPLARAGRRARRPALGRRASRSGSRPATACCLIVVTSAAPRPAGSMPDDERRVSQVSAPRSHEPPACARTGAAATTPGVCLHLRRAPSASPACSSRRRSVSTRMSGLPMRIFSRRSRCRPFITPMIDDQRAHRRPSRRRSRSG